MGRPDEKLNQDWKEPLQLGSMSFVNILLQYYERTVDLNIQDIKTLCSDVSKFESSPKYQDNIKKLSHDLTEHEKIIKERKIKKFHRDYSDYQRGRPFDFSRSVRFADTNQVRTGPSRTKKRPRSILKNRDGSFNSTSGDDSSVTDSEGTSDRGSPNRKKSNRNIPLEGARDIGGAESTRKEPPQVSFQGLLNNFLS